ncbi:hypothetical protein LCGC14_1714140 [marine sediment metagenome]|uniref:Uncharacterized protein n=1 Tax=marine sediment metagenome TaxID=412755 RepID=A0A0F9HEU4_9ZZZZ
MICDICGEPREEWELHIYAMVNKCRDKEKCKKGVVEREGEQ